MAMTISPQLILQASATVTAADALGSGSFRIGIPNQALEFASADIAYGGKLNFTSGTTQFVVDLYQGLVTTPGSGSSRAVGIGLNGKDPDGNTIAMDTLYALVFYAPSGNADTVTIANVATWSDGPLGLEGGAGDGLIDVTPGSTVVMTNVAGWTIASGDEIDCNTAGAGNTELQVFVIGAAA